MSDSEDSTVTYIEVSSLFEDLSDIGSPGVDGLPMMPEDPYAYVVAAFQAPPSPDYVPGPEEPEQAPPSLEFVPEPVYPEFMSPEDETLIQRRMRRILRRILRRTPLIILAIEDDDDDDDESSDDDEDDDDDVEEDGDEEEEEEHPSPADSVPPLVHRVTTRMSIRAQTPISLPSDTKVARLLVIPTPPPSPLSSLRAHARTARLMETKAKLSREAWVQSIDASDTARSEVRALRTTVLAQQTEIAGFRAADRTRQAQLVEILALLRTL
ncbi:hypothetical protein Tco_0678452 [Tanacetum coccineum]|uniref:Uncharacterized protein n=1 Tax=Tanacetum coccineum TaxID=301880 RepID=A0ABQ4XG08_9ASTR